jgi:hypothetical protein
MMTVAAAATVVVAAIDATGAAVVEWARAVESARARLRSTSSRRTSRKQQPPEPESQRAMDAWIHCEAQAQTQMNSKVAAERESDHAGSAIAELLWIAAVVAAAAVLQLRATA